MKFYPEVGGEEIKKQHTALGERPARPRGKAWSTCLNTVEKANKINTEKFSLYLTTLRSLMSQERSFNRIMEAKFGADCLSKR